MVKLSSLNLWISKLHLTLWSLKSCKFLQQFRGKTIELPNFLHFLVLCWNIFCQKSYDSPSSLLTQKLNSIQILNIQNPTWWTFTLWHFLSIFQFQPIGNICTFRNKMKYFIFFRKWHQYSNKEHCTKIELVLQIFFLIIGMTIKYYDKSILCKFQRINVYKNWQQLLKLEMHFSFFSFFVIFRLLLLMHLIVKMKKMSESLINDM